MTKIAIAHNGVGDTIISSLQNELQKKMKQVLNQKEIELLIDTYSSKYSKLRGTFHMSSFPQIEDLLDSHKDVLISTFSGGEQHILALLGVAIQNLNYVLHDEPSDSFNIIYYRFCAHGKATKAYLWQTGYRDSNEYCRY